MKEVKDEIEAIAQYVSDDFMANVYPNLTDDLKGNIRQVSFLAAHPLEIVQTLQEWSQHDELRYEKFPLIGLYLDMPVEIGKSDLLDGVNLNIIIANTTDMNYKSTQREIANFEPILRPLYHLFCKYLMRSSLFEVQSIQLDAKHRYIERYFWGRESLYGNDGNIVNDYIDAIQLQNLQLNFKQLCYNI